MSPNSCSYIATFDFLRGAVWLHHLDIWMNDMPEMVKPLLKHTLQDSDLSQVLPILNYSMK